MKFRFQLSVAIAFTVLTVIVLGVAVLVFYASNKRLALETAHMAMSDAQARSEAALTNIVAPVGRTVETTASLLREIPGGTAGFAGMKVIESQIANLHQVYSAFFGIAATGAFYQVARIPDTMTTFGSAGGAVPEGAATVFRVIEPSTDGVRETLTYFSATGDRLAVETGPGDFDPRKRPWFEVARKTDGVAVSPIYTFDSTGQPGITFSKQVAGPGEDLFAVVGADMSIALLTEELNEIRIGGEGEVFLLDRNSEIITRSDYSGGGQDNPVVDAAIEAWRQHGDELFELNVPGKSGPYLASVITLSPVFGVSPHLGVVVPERQFIGAINDATQRVLLISAIIVLIAVFATVMMARMLSTHLRMVSEEARRISEFDLSGDFTLSSKIVEVNDLESAVSNMKTSLGSFGAYVPKDLVRFIVGSGETVKIGGTSRELTILFSDIQDFTRKSESMPPETVMRDLSRYFEEMYDAISRNHGAIDKYIGDAVMALWNAPAEDPDHVAHACRAVLACKAAERELNAVVGNADLFPTRTRFGLHTDQVVVGNVGSANRLQYTAIGGAVNLASRLEALNKVYGTDILVTQTVVDRAGEGFVFCPVDRVSPAGTTEPIAIFELVGDEASAEHLSDAARQEIADWAAFYSLYQARDWPAALSALTELGATASRGQLVALYTERCRGFIETPPPADWDGVHVFSKK